MAANAPQQSQATPENEEQIRFAYRGVDPLGARIKGYVYAEGAAEARRLLEESELKEVEVWPRRAGFLSGLRGRRVSRTDVGVFALQLAQRTKANQPIRFAVSEMAKTSTHQGVRGAL